jgi:hypothetical protein
MTTVEISKPDTVLFPNELPKVAEVTNVPRPRDGAEEAPVVHA